MKLQEEFGKQVNAVYQQWEADIEKAKQESHKEVKEENDEGGSKDEGAGKSEETKKKGFRWTLPPQSKIVNFEQVLIFMQQIFSYCRIELKNAFCRRTTISKPIELVQAILLALRGLP